VPPQPLLIAPGVRDVEGERVLPGTVVAGVRPHSYNAWSFHRREAVKLQSRVPEARHEALARFAGRRMRKRAAESSRVDSAGRWRVTTRCALGVLPVVLLIVAMADANPPAQSGSVMTPDHVVATLNRSLGWYQEARVVMRSLEASTGEVFARDDQQTALTVLRRAFDTAQAEATLVGLDSAPAPQNATRPAEKTAELEHAIQDDLREVARLRNRVRVAAAPTRAAVQRQLAAATNRLDLDRARLEFLTRFAQFDALAPDVSTDLAHQIQALQDAVPELQSRGASPEPATPPTASAPGTVGAIRRLLLLERNRSSLNELARTTNQLARSVDDEIRTTRATFDPMTARLRALTNDPTAEGTTLADGQRVFQDLLARAKAVAPVLPPLREESELIHRFATDLAAWNRTVDRDVREALGSLVIGLVGVVLALAVIAVGTVLWRVTSRRYVHDAVRRRLVTIAGNVLAVAAIGLVLVFHFSSELAALVTGLGFAAAGIAFALQNVILAVAGYFSMMTPGDGIRVGDRVSLQGPFGYVEGDVLEIGLVRIRLREVAGEPPRPTGRVVVFPNSVVFTGSFFKHPRAADAQAQAPLKPAA
jgi:Mechanosensitive ion channel